MVFINCKREHPLIIFYKVIKAVPILIFPLVFILFPELTAAWEVLHFYRFYVFILLPILIWAVIYRYCEKLNVFSNSLRIKKGIFFKRDLKISSYAVSAVTVGKTPITALFKCKRLTVFPATASFPIKPSLILPDKVADSIAQQITKAALKNCNKVHSFSSAKIKVMSAMDSNWSGGLLILIPFFNNAGKIVGESITNEIYVTFTDKASELLPMFDPVVAVITTLIFLGWLIQYINLIIKNSRFSLGKSSEAIFTLSGLISRRHRIIPFDNISGIEYKNTLVSMLFNLQSVRVVSKGARKETSGEFLIMPAETKAMCNKITDCIFDKPKVVGKKVTPRTYDRGRYCTIPICIFLGLFVLGLKLGAGETLISQIIFLLSALTLWWLTVRFVASKKAFIRLDSDSISICSSKCFSVYRQRIFRSEVEEAVITSNPIQQYVGICNVYIRAKGSKRGIRCYHLPTNEVRAIVERLL